MVLPAISTSQSIYFRSKHSRKPRPDAPIFTSLVHSLCTSNHHTSSAWKTKKLPISTKYIKSSSLNSESQITKGEWIHFVGIGGCGMSALAMLAVMQGSEVSGSDLAWSSFMDCLHDAGARMYIGHSVSNIQRNVKGSCLPNALVVSSAIPSDNVEILHAKAMGVPIYKRGAWLRIKTEHSNLIAVSGTHGKSTVAGMLAYVLSAMGDDATAIVGAHVPQLAGGNVLCGRSRNFILEADEYDDCFIQLSPKVAVVTNVEWEHVDMFQDEEAVKKSFKRFLKQIRVGGHLILCGDSEGACSLLSDTSIGIETALSELSSQPVDAGYSITTYGISSSNDWHASSIFLNSRGGTDYVLYHMGHVVADISIQLAGIHNVLNSLAVIATVGVLFSERWPTKKLINCIKPHLNTFIGVSRRFEEIGHFNACHVFDDYAHHPTEVRAVIQAARQKYEVKPLFVVFQPHTFSRLAKFMEAFATALGDADRVIVTEVYASRETYYKNVTGRDLAMSIIGPPSEYIPSLADVVDKLALDISRNPDREVIILTLGAGDVTIVGPKLLEKLQQIQTDTHLKGSDEPHSN